jgi:hypothetical protein
MKILIQRLAALCLTAAALSSCNRAAYTFTPQAPTYLGSTPTVAAPAPQNQTSATVTVEPTVAAPVASRAVASPAATTAQAAVVARVTDPTLATTKTTAAKPTLVQRIALKKVLKQVAKAESRQQNTASVTHTAAKGAPLTVAIVGLAALVVGLIASSGLLITLGAIVLAVGIVLLILSAL